MLRSDNGDTWKEHQSDARTEDLTELLVGMDEGRVIQLCPTYSKPEFNNSFVIEVIFARGYSDKNQNTSTVPEHVHDFIRPESVVRDRNPKILL